jgi:hypothetical protein
MIEGEQEEFTAEALRRGGVQIAKAGPDLLSASASPWFNRPCSKAI